MLSFADEGHRLAKPVPASIAFAEVRTGLVRLMLCAGPPAAATTQALSDLRECRCADQYIAVYIGYEFDGERRDQ